MKNAIADKMSKSSLLEEVNHYHALNIARHHEFHLVYLDRTTALDQQLNLLYKRLFDLMVSFILLILVGSWLFPLIALLIKLDSGGPVFFLQKRSKKDGKPFECIKFRTMFVNDKADVMPAVINDVRVTGFGRFLRQHHLDELPQLFNVLLGDMSMIGPRPYMISDNEKYERLIKNYSVRHKVKPGITGLAQVLNYINPIVNLEDMEERVRKDVYYVYNWSPLLDAKIIARTVLKMAAIK